ncbi:MAG: aminotransferase class IV [Bacteroidia bacterium]|nr:aminotransferase class IV [Bacteroidia bacterium]
MFETIRISDGKPENLYLHNERLNHSRKQLFGKNDQLKLEDYINVTENLKKGLFRCRVIYSDDVISVEFSQYVPAVIKTLKKVNADWLKYDHKFLDRTPLLSLIDKNVADDILIVQNGFITDTSYANIVFTDGERWVTPDSPLLKGTMRAFLLGTGKIFEDRITINDLSRFTHLRMINAMLGFAAPLIPVSSII